MYVQQFVMAYGVEQDRLRTLLPEGLTSLRPVLRLNAELRDGRSAYLEFNTAVERQGFRGWRNIAHWEGVPFTAEGENVLFHPPFLRLRFTGVGIQGGCPAEQDNLRLGFRHPRGPWPEPGEDPPRHPHGAENRLSPPGPDGGKRRHHPLPAGPGRLPGDLPALSAAPRSLPEEGREAPSAANHP